MNVITNLTKVMMTLAVLWSFSSAPVRAQTPCMAGFSVSIGSSSPNGTQVAFYDSSWSAGTITNWNWSFGNGTGSTQQNPTTTLAPGAYYVCLTITAIYQGQSCTAQYCDSIYVTGTQPCNPNFTYQINPAGVQFFASGTLNVQWVWDFGDGTGSSSMNPTHTYNSPGTYNVCLVTLTGNGQQCSSCQTITITGGGTTCNASFNANQVQGTTTWNFTNTSTGNIGYYVWDFGDGTFSTLVNPSHTYTANGTYYACLTISDSMQSCIDTYCDTIIVGTGTSCNANFGWQNNPANGSTSFSAVQAGNMSWYWDFGDGTTGTGANINHSFAPGTYNVCLTVTTVNGLTCTSCQTVTIQLNALCSSNFSVFPDSSQAHTYIAYNLATGAMPMTYLWSWGDGTSSTGAYPSHTYQGPGLYTICLTITDANGCTSTTCNPYQLLRLSSSAPVTINVVAGSTGINETDISGQISVYPMPASDLLNVSISLVKNDLVSTRIFNSTGQRVLEVEAQEFASGSHTLKLNVQQLSPGIYTLETRIGNARGYSKVLIY